MYREPQDAFNKEINYKWPAKLPQDGNKEDSSALA